jgi:hypothetical protein
MLSIHRPKRGSWSARTILSQTSSYATMMAANTAPIYSKTGDTSTNGTTGMAALVTTANNDYVGTNAAATLVFTANATNGGFIERLRFKAGGTNVATVARIYINNGSTPTTAANNALYGEVSLPATTAIATAATDDIDYPMNIALPAGFRIYFQLATAVAAGWACTGIGGQY